jgi:DNA-binding winged helix-turn-helix (wHTH) protein/tetratricopeptide (TPR) repeat protein
MSLNLKGMYRFDEFELDPARRCLLRDGQSVSISPKAFEVLLCLLQHPGELVTKDQLLAAVWPGAFVEEDNLVQHISALRKAFGERARYIVTVPGRGYQFTAPVEQTNAAAMQRVRERTRIVMEESITMPAQKALPTTAQRLTSRWVAWTITSLVLFAVAGYLAWQRFGPKPQLRKVEVADFLNLTGDHSIDHTLKSALTFSLSQTPYIQLMGDGLTHSTLQEMQKSPDTPLLGDIALEVCARGHYQALLRGKIEHPQQFGYDLTLEVTNCTNGKNLAVFKGHALTTDAILDTLDDLSRRIRVKLGEPNASLDQFNVPLIEATTFSFEALKDFNIGSQLGNEGKLKECIDYFQKAVDIDPKFAMAQASLGTAYYNLGSMDKAAVYYKNAFDLSSNVSQWEKFYIRAGYYLAAVRDLQAATKNWEQYAKAYPEDATTWEGLANADTQVGDFGRAIEAGEHAVKYGQIETEESYQILANAYKRANRFSDVKRIIAEAQAGNKDAPDLHQLLYRIAMIEHDPETLQRESAWSKGKPELYAMLESQAILAADEGKPSESEDLFKSAIADAAHEVDADLADSILMDQVSVEIQLGRTAQAIELLHKVQHRDTANFAILQTRAGDIAAGEAYLLKPEKYPQDTIEHFLRIPELKALVALSHKDPGSAIAALEPARPFELVRCEVIEIRAEIYLAAGQPDKAALEFQKLIANPGLEDIMQPRTVLSHLGLARALTAQSRTAEGRHEYEAFFALWKDASNLPTLEQAHREYSHLPLLP